MAQHEASKPTKTRSEGSAIAAKGREASQGTREELRKPQRSENACGGAEAMSAEEGREAAP